ncbi:hypothetical protein IJS77_02110 [bacterium]|nr:hypothetical protein [bacterium]
MKVQNINQSSIYQFKSRQDGSAGISQNCCPKPKPNLRVYQNDSISFKGKVSSAKPKTLISEIGVLMENTCNSIRDSFNKSNTKKYLIAPIQKKWSDFAYKAPRTARAIKSAAIVTAFVTALDSGK